MIADADIGLLDRWQRDFPLVARPFEAIARAEGSDQATIIDRFGRLVAQGALSRIGAVVRPHAAGWSTLAAMAVPERDLARVAAIVSAHPGVNHNYAREHRLNLWFVATGPDRASVEAALAELRARTGLAIVDLPLEKSYHIDLGFPLIGERPVATRRVGAARMAEGADRRLVAALADGLSLTAEPFAPVADAVGLTEAETRLRIGQLVGDGVIARFGCVVRHRALGFTANAMAVWDVPDDVVDAVAARMIGNRHVTLCYRRPRRRPEWRFNLFCMIHARSRADATGAIADINAIAGTAQLDQAVLFSTQCFKQRGASFGALAGAAA